MSTEQLKEEIIREINRISQWEGTDKWGKVRSLDIFKNELASDLYEGMQASRGLNFTANSSFEQNIQEVVQAMDSPLNQQDKERHQEIQNYINLSDIDNVFELGFRAPKILKLYKNLGKNVQGLDVVRANCLVGEYLGYDCFRHDLSSDEDIEVKDNSLIISYHCFEHLPDPEKAIRKVRKSIKNNCYFHIEVPTENISSPNVAKAHCFAFKSGSLQEMLENAGFKVIKSINSHNQRCLCVPNVT